MLVFFLGICIILDFEVEVFDIFEIEGFDFFVDVLVVGYVKFDYFLEYFCFQEKFVIDVFGIFIICYFCYFFFQDV